MWNLHWIREDKLETAEENISEMEARPREFIQNETHKKN